MRAAIVAYQGTLGGESHLFEVIVEVGSNWRAVVDLFEVIVEVGSNWRAVVESTGTRCSELSAIQILKRREDSHTESPLFATPCR